MSPIRPIVGIFDVHVPDHDQRLWASWLDWCRDERPSEVIIGGDFLDLESCSEHGGVARPALFKDEIEAGKQALSEVRNANPNAKITYLEGNHETRLTRKIVHRLSDLDGAVTIPDALQLSKLGVTWHKYGDVVMRGKLGVTHGWWTNEHHAAKHLRRAKCSIAYGHTHKPQVFTDGGVHGDVNGAFGMPCMRTLSAEWLNGQPAGWIQGFGVFYVQPNGNFTPYTVLAFNGVFVWGGKPYGATHAANDDTEDPPLPPTSPPSTPNAHAIPPAVQRARDELVRMLEHGPRPASECEHTLGWRARDAKRAIGARSVQRFRDDGTSFFAWALPADLAAEMLQ